MCVEVVVSQMSLVFSALVRLFALLSDNFSPASATEKDL